MLMLGIESSAKAASAALVRDGELIGQYIQNSGLTHSRTLLPMAEDLMKNTETSLSDLDALAVSVGPGSFTGVRIGVSTVKGLCWGAQKPAIGVSTLAAMAWNGTSRGEGALICCCMDARRGQLYNALFEIRGGSPFRLCVDRAAPVEEIEKDILSLKKVPFLVGDGAALCYNYLNEKGMESVLAPEPLLYQNAWGVCMEARNRQSESAAQLLPVYLRLSQAERERQAKMETSNEIKGEKL